ncbi:unnamed protein product [Ranitomeya imitator]|uniref:GIY-YIG domain-containing protein n=1 Tax=Ranitomeya imitator TaxID=111125 RepID=A0ABN9KN19_9NEOB|nr:unnamed protein product [Ranitomeya imitator]
MVVLSDAVSTASLIRSQRQRFPRRRPRGAATDIGGDSAQGRITRSQDDFYLQIRGTAMGSNVAPPYANCYMADFEESQIYPHPLFRDHVLVWKRYIDDVFCIWGGSLEALAFFFDWLNTAWPVPLLSDSHIRRCFFVPYDHTVYSIILQYDGPPNLKDSLVKADVGTNKLIPRQRFLQNPRTGTFPCLHCSQCNNVLKGSTFHHPHSGKTFHIPDFFTCDTSWAIYLIKCPCGLLYVGETTQAIRNRISKHKSTIRCQNLLLPIPSHFIAKGHSISQLKFQVIEHVPQLRRGGNRITRLKRREAFWIHNLDTLHPKGLNRDYDLAAFL